jgi:hypothetical protein
MIERRKAHLKVNEARKTKPGDRKAQHDVIDAIYDSIGTCGECCLRGEQDCTMVFYCDAFGWVDESEYDGYCHKFMSKEG